MSSRRGSGYFFERQNDRDCTIHSLNNAAGRVVITKKQVIEYIDGLVAEYAKANVRAGPADIAKYRARMSDGSSFFTARVVWDAALAAGTVAAVTPVPGFGGAFAKMQLMPSWIRGRSLIFLGLGARGGMPHAVGARENRIYDSERSAPVLLNDAELARSLRKVFAAFVVTLPEEDAPRMVRTKPMGVSKIKMAA